MEGRIRSGQPILRMICDPRQAKLFLGFLGDRSKLLEAVCLIVFDETFLKFSWKGGLLTEISSHRFRSNISSFIFFCEYL